MTVDVEGEALISCLARWTNLESSSGLPSSLEPLP